MTSAPHYADDQVTLYHGDCLDVLRSLPDASVDAIVCDPPYGLEFMGREWDSFKPSSARIRTRVDGRTNPAEGKSTTATPEAYVAGQPFQRWCEAWAREALRVLKPGGHMLAFGGTRTWHRLVCAVEDAGFEIRDSMAWMYGSGFPKSLDVSRAIDKAADAEREARHWEGWGTALKPGFEPIVVARKPLIGTVAANVTAHGTGGLNIDACRVPHASAADLRESAAKNQHADFGSGPVIRHVFGPDHRDSANYDGTAGRWPTNVVMSHAPLLGADGDIIGDACADGCVPGCPVAELDAQSGFRRPGEIPAQAGVTGRPGYDGGWKTSGGDTRVVLDSGGASRFFPTFRYEAKAPDHERPRVNGTAHPTVKPLELIRWLVRLATPPGGTVLEPFAGSGTTVEAALMEGFRVAGIERDADYLPLIQARVERAHRRLQPGVARLGKAKPPAQLAGQTDLLAEIGGVA